MSVTRSLGVALVAAVALVAGSPAGATAKNAGPAVLVEPTTGVPVRWGGSATAWALKLPRRASCSGDSASDAHFVYSYLAPVRVDPGTLRFNPGTGVDEVAGARVYPLIDTFGSAYLSRNTAPDSGLVMPGTAFTFNRLSVDGAAGGRLGPGTYNVGIACWDANMREADRYWNARVTFRASTEDPNGLVWRTAPAPLDRAADESMSTGIYAGVGAGLVALAAVGVGRRRRRRARPSRTAPTVAR